MEPGDAKKHQIYFFQYLVFAHENLRQEKTQHCHRRVNTMPISRDKEGKRTPDWRMTGPFVISANNQGLSRPDKLASQQSESSNWDLFFTPYLDCMKIFTLGISGDGIINRERSTVRTFDSLWQKSRHGCGIDEATPSRWSFPTGKKKYNSCPRDWLRSVSCERNWRPFCSETPRTSLHYGIEGFKGELQLWNARRQSSLGHPRKAFAVLMAVCPRHQGIHKFGLAALGSVHTIRPCIGLFACVCTWNNDVNV